MSNIYQPSSTYLIADSNPEQDNSRWAWRMYPRWWSAGASHSRYVDLRHNNRGNILFVDGRAIQLQLPVTIEMEVTDAPEGLKGDSVSNVQKSVTLETGLVVHAPLFIKTGERIRINTENKEYQGRA